MLYLGRRVAALALALVAVAAVGCGGDDEPELAPGLAFQHGREIEQGMSKKEVAEHVDQEPVLSSGPVPGAPGGCEYYVMRDRAPTNIWAFCFDEQESVSIAEPRFALADRPPPDGASPARAALLGAGDGICQRDYSELDDITMDVGAALIVYESDPTERKREAVGDAIAKFSDNLESTAASLSAFDAPPDEHDVLTAYIDSLNSQVEVLEEATAAFLAGDEKTYDKLGDKFNEISDSARNEASLYGFGVCSASEFG